MSIAVKTPSLPDAATEARVGHWNKAIGDDVARHELLGKLFVGDGNEQVPIFAPQAGFIEFIFFPPGATVTAGAVLVQLKTGLPNLVWDDGLKLDTYRLPKEVNTSMEYELRHLLRDGEAKIGKGFGSGLAPPQLPIDRSESGMGLNAGMSGRSQFKRHPALAESSQFAGDNKDPQATAVPSNSQAQKSPQNAPTLGAKLHYAPGAPTPRPSGG